MSPFAMTLRELRATKRLRQTEAAELLGYEQTYISALEVGTKESPPKAFLDREVRALNLDETWEKRLREAHDASRRRIVIPAVALNFTQAITIKPIPTERLRRRVSDKSRKGKGKN